MAVRGAINLSLSNGVILVSGTGVVTIKQGLTAQRMPLITAYPFAQPQPYYVLDDGDPVTTDGARLLFQLATESKEPVRVTAGYDLLAMLLISPQGLVMADLAPDMLVARRDTQGDRTCRHTLEVPEERFGLKPGSLIQFTEGVLSSVTFGPLNSGSERGWDGGYKY